MDCKITGVICQEFFTIGYTISVNCVIDNHVKFQRNNRGLNRKALSDYLKSKTVLGGKFSYRNVAARAGLSHATIGNIINLKYKKDIGIDTLRAIAHGLEEPENTLLAVAFDQPLDSQDLNDELLKSILADFEKLLPEDREFFRPYLLMMRSELDRRLSLNQTTKPNATRQANAGLTIVPKGEQQVIDLMAITDRLRAQGFDVDDGQVEAVIVGEATDADPDLIAAILTAAGIVSRPEYQSGKSGL
jgi:transcriptional regulator with XRE-family HTH domain